MDNKNELKKAIDKSMDEIAKSLHLYQVVDWLEEKIEKFCDK